MFNSPPVLYDNSVIQRVATHKHLGLYLTSNLDWSTQIDQLSLKAHRKLAVLRSVKFLQRKTLSMLYKVTVRSIIDYGLPIYYNNLRQTEVAKLNRIQYSAAKIVTGAFQYSSQEKLELDLGWETLRNRFCYLGVTLFHKIHLHQTRPLLRFHMPPIEPVNNYNLRVKGGYSLFQARGVYFSKSFFTFFTKFWNNLDKTLRSNTSLSEFKDQMSKYLKPKKYKHYNIGNKYANQLATKMRIGRSSLNSHSFSIGLTDTPSCPCGHLNETSQHYILDCMLYATERQNLFDVFEHYITNFNTLTRKKKLDILLYGFNIDNNDFLYTNYKLSLAFQKFLLNSKRFQ